MFASLFHRRSKKIEQKKKQEELKTDFEKHFLMPNKQHDKLYVNVPISKDRISSFEPSDPNHICGTCRYWSKNGGGELLGYTDDNNFFLKNNVDICPCAKIWVSLSNEKQERTGDGWLTIPLFKFNSKCLLEKMGKVPDDFEYSISLDGTHFAPVIGAYTALPTHSDENHPYANKTIRIFQE